MEKKTLNVSMILAYFKSFLGSSLGDEWVYNDSLYGSEIMNILIPQSHDCHLDADCFEYTKEHSRISILLTGFGIKRHSTHPNPPPPVPMTHPGI